MTRRGNVEARHIQELAAQFLNSEANRNTLITVTRAESSSDGKRATVYFSVFPAEASEQALHFLRRKRATFRLYLKERLRSGRIPFVDFQVDYGEKNRQRIEELSKE